MKPGGPVPAAGTYPYEPRSALRHLRRHDPRLAELINRVGPYRLALTSRLTIFQALLRAVVYQQLSGHAARRIHERVLERFPRRRATAAALLATGESALRDAGLSRNKTLSVIDLAEKTLSGALPTRRAIARMDDERVIEAFTQVRGIGRWTVEMLLIFHLGRPDVLPVSDLGIRKGFQRAWQLPELPAPDALMRRGEAWRPYRSVASWYLWRANELPIRR